MPDTRTLTRLRQTLLAIIALFTLHAVTPVHAGEAVEAPAPASQPVVQIVHMSVRQEALPAFEHFMHNINKTMQDVPGFISIAVYQDKAAPTEFTLVEVWRTEADHQAHIARISASGDLTKFGEMLATAPEAGYFRGY